MSCHQIYPPELQFNKANASDYEVPFLDLHLSISNGLFHPKRMKKGMTLIFILGRHTSYGVYICQLLRFARVCSHVDDFNACNEYLTA